MVNDIWREKMKRGDKRSQKTVKALQDALLHMLTEKDLSAIRIIDLCRCADINRTTFYLHFDNTDDVLRSIREEIVERIFTQYRGESFLYTMEHPLRFLMTCTQVISSYEGFERFVRFSDEAAYFLEELKKSFAAKVFADYKKEYPDSNGASFYIINFLTAGTFDTYIVWLRSEQHCPLADLFDRFGKIFAAGHEALSQK